MGRLKHAAMEKVFKVMLLIVMLIMLLTGVTGVVGGLIEGAWHAVLLGGMMLALLCAWYGEAHRDD